MPVLPNSFQLEKLPGLRKSFHKAHNKTRETRRILLYVRKIKVVDSCLLPRLQSKSFVVHRQNKPEGLKRVGNFVAVL